ncbi:glycine--tRNA ligase subunit beta [Aerococcaceae bacterium NML190938]|nr:glycine--tRNA ligase subunit beta [Aerococcaceae bacterium NML191219]MCW6666415.1 glycine--tRNA ligase subunit beta [Aerococcaceae bacterium NML190938]MCW6675383.1 glycine--tRNA ligase subunit beta [Aerococcaceae bacterium NML171108]MCW6680717.1 glycine--tRNA ligase subunit beta [Aerococcaceae bacterium NML130460]
MTQYLLEIGLEEVPARFLLNLSNQLAERVGNFLQEERVTYDNIETFATPRRLAVRVNGLSERQADIHEKAKGPALKIAKDATGEWSKAALGFLRGQQATPEDIVIEAVNGEDYIFVNKFIEGKLTSEVLTNIGIVLKQMTFPVTMSWNTYEVPFIRPVHWLVSLLEDQVVPFEFVGVSASNITRGHRFLGDEVTIKHPCEYETALFEQKVVVSFAERRQMIEQQIHEIADEKGWNVPIDEDLLAEVTSIVEWPTAFYGEFESQYLEVPRMVLVTAMKDHQRYFYAEDKATGELLPIFISVRNGNAAHIENVIKGNRKVLRARLEDALFFYKEDLKHDLSFYLEKLEKVNEHFKLGTLADKQRRVMPLIERVAQLVEADSTSLQAAKRAAAIYKFDLMTQVVGEFDELQGQMGEVYATHYGEDDLVANAIGTQYLPNSSGGILPNTEAGALLAFADKLDTLSQYFAVGLVPTGSNDPYALRRQAMGMVEIALSQGWHIDFLELLRPLATSEEVFVQLVDFVKARVQQVLSRQQIDFDIIQSTLSASHLTVAEMIEAAQLLATFKQKNATEYREFVEAMTRAVNLGVKDTASVAPQIALAQTESEQALMAAVLQLTATESLQERIDQLRQLNQLIESYFELNKVNADEQHIRDNRYATLGVLTRFVLNLMDPRELISKF